MTSDSLDRQDQPTPTGLGEGPIYLDYNSTTPVDPRVTEALLPYLTSHFGRVWFLWKELGELGF